MTIRITSRMITNRVSAKNLDFKKVSMAETSNRIVIYQTKRRRVGIFISFSFCVWPVKIYVVVKPDRNAWQETRPAARHQYLFSAP